MEHRDGNQDGDCVTIVWQRPATVTASHLRPTPQRAPDTDVEVSINGVPDYGWFIMENPKIGDLGVPPWLVGNLHVDPRPFVPIDSENAKTPTPTFLQQYSAKFLGILTLGFSPCDCAPKKHQLLVT